MKPIKFNNCNSRRTALLAMGLLACLPALPTFAATSQPTPNATTAKTQGIQWGSSLQDALTQAKKTGLPVMASFDATWCPWCQQMEQNTYTDAKVIAESKKFLAVHIDTDSDQGQQLSQKYNITGIPAVLFFKPNGSIAQQQNGYADATDFLKVMRAAV